MTIKPGSILHQFPIFRTHECPDNPNAVLFLRIEYGFTMWQPHEEEEEKAKLLVRALIQSGMDINKRFPGTRVRFSRTVGEPFKDHTGNPRILGHALFPSDLDQAQYILEGNQLLNKLLVSYDTSIWKTTVVLRHE